MSDFQVDGSVTADVASFIRGFREMVSVVDEAKHAIDELSAKIDELSNKDVKVKVDIVGADEITRLREDLDRLANTHFEVRVGVAADQGSITRLREDLDRLNAVGNTTIDVRVNVTGMDSLRLLRLELDYLTMTRHVVRVDVNTGTGIAQLVAMSAALQGVQASGNGAASGVDNASGAMGGGGGGGMIGAIMLLIPVIAALGQVTAGVAAGLVGSFAVIGVGLGAFALFAIPTISQVTKVMGDLAKGTKQADEEWAKLSTPMKIAVTNLQSLKIRFTELQKELQPTILTVFAEGLNLARAGLEDLAKVAKPAGEALAPVLKMFATNLMGGELSRFFKYVADNIGFFIIQWGTAVLNFIGGITNMIQAFDPLSKFVTNGLVDMSQSFLEWSQNLAQNKGFQDFVNFVMQNGGKVLDLIGKLVGVLWDLITAFSPIGMQMIGIIASVLKMVSVFTKAHPEVMKWVALGLALGGALMIVVPIVMGLVAAVSELTLPIIAVIAVIALIVMAILEWWKHCATFRDFVMEMWNKIVTFFKQGITQAKEQVNAILPLIVELWNKYGKNIMDIVRGIWSIISSVISGAMQIIGGIIRVVLGLLTGNWSAAWNGIVSIVKGVWTIIKGLVSGALSIIKGLLGGFVNQMSNVGGAIIHGLWQGMQAAYGWLKSQFEGMLKDLRGMLPFSPAKTGPFSGTGYTTYSGAALVTGLAEGIKSRSGMVKDVTSKMTMMVHGALPKGTDFATGTSSAARPSNGGAMMGAMALAGSGGPGAVFQPGAIQINNPAQEPASDSLNRSMTRISRFGLFQGSGGN